MRAMVLAAGRGQRMRPLTDALPKPLLRVGGKPLIVWTIERLVQAGIRDIIINHAWLGQCIEDALGDGKQFGAHISYSPENPALETAGGIARALPFFNDQPFLVVNGDIWCDWDPTEALGAARQMQSQDLLAWLVLVDNPPQHPKGDFCLNSSGLVTDPLAQAAAPALTFSGIGVYHPMLFNATLADQPAALAPLLRQAITQDRVAGARHHGRWTDVGTPQRLDQLNQQLISG